jgi:epoxyqueuosine reductase
MGRHVFGCDICQDVCPWNRKAPITSAPEFSPRPGFINPALEWLAEISAEQFREAFRGSPIRRTKRSGIRRNTVIALGNSRRPEVVPLLEKLARDEDKAVAESARWALVQIQEHAEAPARDNPKSITADEQKIR